MENKKKPGEAREKIVETALRLFYSQGIRATGVDTIIEDSGVAKMTFYKHFPSKQKLVVEVLHRAEELWFEGLQRFVQARQAPRERLLAVFDYLAGWFNDADFRGCAFINTAAESPDRVAEECVLSARHKKQVARYLEELAKAAGFSAQHAFEVGEKFLLLIDGAIVRAMMEGAPKAAKTARSVAELVLDSTQARTGAH